MDMPTYQGAVESNYSGGATARLQGDVQNLAPLATTFVTPQAQSFGAPMTPTSSGTPLSKFAHFLGGVVSGTWNAAEGASKWLLKNTEQIGAGLVDIPKATINFAEGAYEVRANNNQLDQLTAQQQNLGQMWRAGRISSQEYRDGLQNILKQQQDLATNLKTTQNKLGLARQESGSALKSIATIATIVLTDGIGGSLEEGAAAKYLTSINANSFLDVAEQSLSKVASDPELFAKLTPTAQKALQTATAEVVANAGRASAGQIARAAVVNLAFKYPLTYSFVAPTGTQIYKDLQDKKYGAAINTAAINALIAVGGGVLGEAALGATGKGVRAAVSSVFSRSPFIDELSSGLFNDPEALFRAAAGNPERIKALSDLEATHMAATGNDPVAAAWRVINGEKSVDGLNATDKGPEGWLDHNIKWAQNAKMATATAKKYNLGPVSVGRWTANNAQMVQGELDKSTTIEGKLNVWESLKQQYPDSAFANNPNLDTQIKHLISTGRDAEVGKIKAGRFLEGFPEAEARLMAKDGFLPISGAKHAASYVEGSGTLASRFAKDEEFFVRATPPLPVLGSVGALFTKLGLSPYASTAQVHDLYNANLANNLKNTRVAQKVADFLNEGSKDVKPTEVKSSTFSAAEIKDLQKQGYTPEIIAKLEKGSISEEAISPTSTESTTTVPSKDEVDGATYARKIIASYANSPDGKLLSGARIMDERQMTTKDLIKAFSKKGINISTQEAHELQLAISRSHLDISTAVKGLGDRAVDFLYATPGLGSVERRFLRLQGSLRFTFNPFFQYLRAIPKLEILSEAQGGGFVKSIFVGRTKQMGEVREGLRKAGFLNETGSLGNISTDEAFLSDSGRNLHKQLLPAQENSIAGLVDSLSQKAGVAWQEYIAENPDKTRDLIQSIAEYDRNADFLNSPLARTLNVAFFPFRFETKVLQIFTKSLARQDYLTRVAVIQGIAKAHDFLASPQGQAWYQQNADAIGMFKYITPIASFNEVFHSLLPGNDHSLGNFGELGGLPFGWIPQILDAEGLTHFNQPGVDAKTGVVYNQYVPATARGQVAIAIQDLIGSLFSYPGATAGLPSKTSMTRAVALDIVGGTKSKDLKSVTPPFPHTQAINALLHGPQSVVVPNSESQIAPSRSTSITTPKYKSGGSKKLKKSQFTPQLLPGQSGLGQL